MAKRRAFFPVGVLMILAASDASADPPSSTAGLKIVGGAVAFGASYAFVRAFARPDLVFSFAQ